MWGNTFSEKKDIHKFTWVSGMDDHKSLLDFIVVQEEKRNKLLDVNVLRGAGGGNIGLSFSNFKNKMLEEVDWEKVGRLEIVEALKFP